MWLAKLSQSLETTKRPEKILSVLGPLSRGATIAIWGAAVYCLGDVADSLVVGVAKPTFRTVAGKELLRLSSPVPMHGSRLVGDQNDEQCG